MIELRRLPIVDVIADPERQINRRPSAVLARAVPWVSVALGSIFAAVLWIASAPLLPPFGLLLFIAWRQLRPGLLPIWAGLPLGLIDDMLSGQPLGSAVLLWSLGALLLDALEARVPWRGFGLDWVVAAALITATIVLGALIANATGGATPLANTAPQIGLALLCYPLAARIVAALDRFRLLPFMTVREWT